jgi:hypothetical protein
LLVLILWREFAHIVQAGDTEPEAESNVIDASPSA